LWGEEEGEEVEETGLGEEGGGSGRVEGCEDDVGWVVGCKGCGDWFKQGMRSLVLGFEC